jgi:alkanesulfonate monooxygenase SsuD/methylene tetrahydromethanopterin reductase-like flavin-dependent oxidoreductase (luciferase family)
LLVASPSRGAGGARRYRFLRRRSASAQEVSRFGATEIRDSHGEPPAFTKEELDGMSGMQAMRDRVMQVIGHNPTVRDFREVTRRGRPREAVVGSGKDIADRLEQWFQERACDGFVVAGTHIPGSFEDFVRFVVPELQRRGLYGTEYTGATLRENLGLPVPKRGAWRLSEVAA